MKLKLYFILAVLTVMMACKRDEKTAAPVEKASPGAMAAHQRLKKYVDSVFLTRSVEKDSFYTSEKIYEDAKLISTGMKGDTTTPELLFRAGALVRGRKDPTKAIGIWGLITSDYPGSKWASEAAFQKAFTFDNDLHDKATAKQYYEAFLKQYPNHKLAGDVRLLLPTLEKTDAQLIEEFEKKNKANQ